MEEWIEVKFRALTFITIIMTVIWNVYLFIETARAAGGLSFIVTGPRGARLSTLVSLMLGDILVALFSQMVRLDYLISKSGSCSTVNASTIYMMYLLPFVHCIGLCVMAVEGVMFRVQDQVYSFPIINLFVSTIPWILGTSIVLPLALEDSDIDICGLGHHEDKLKILLITCQVLPTAVCLCVTTACLLIMWRVDFIYSAKKYKKIAINGRGLVPKTLDKSTEQQRPESNSDVKRETDVSLVEVPLVLPLKIHMDKKEMSPVLQPVSADKRRSLEGSSVDSALSTHKKSSGQSKRLSIVLTEPNPSPDNGQVTLSESKFQADCFKPALEPNGHTAEGEYLSLASLTPSTCPYLTQHEKSALLLATLAFVACTLPNPVINIVIPLFNTSTSIMKFSDRLPLKDFGYWMFSARSFVSPFVWLVTKNVTSQ